MFYRFKSKMATWDRLMAHPVPYPEDECLPDFPGLKTFCRIQGVSTYEAKFVPCSNTNFGEPYTILEAPFFHVRFRPCIRFEANHEDLQIPDLCSISDYLVCSGKFKEVIEQNDDFKHEFQPIEFLNQSWEPILLPQTYYVFNVRRFVTVPVSTQNYTSFSFIPTSYEEQLFYQLKSNPNVTTELAKLPIWRFAAEEAELAREQMSLNIVYFSQKIMSKLKSENLTGLDIYSIAGGKAEESVILLTQEVGAWL